MEPDNDLGLRLLALAGAIMEDASAIAIIDTGKMEAGARADTVAKAAAEAHLLARVAAIAFDPRTGSVGW